MKFDVVTFTYKKHLVLQEKWHHGLKISFYVFIFPLVMLGVFLSVAGIWMRSDQHVQSFLVNQTAIYTLCPSSVVGKSFTLHSDIDSYAFFLIFLGVVVLCICILGFCGTFKERHTLLAGFTLLTLTLMALLLLTAIVASEESNQFPPWWCEPMVRRNLESRILLYKPPPVAIEGSRHAPPDQDKVSQGLDNIQELLSCCGGINGSLNYDIIGKEIPDTCYPLFTNETINKAKRYNLNCYDAVLAMYQAIDSNITVIMITSIVLGLLTLGTVILSGTLTVLVRHAKGKM